MPKERGAGGQNKEKAQKDGPGHCLLAVDGGARPGSFVSAPRSGSTLGMWPKCNAGTVGVEVEAHELWEHLWEALKRRY